MRGTKKRTVTQRRIAQMTDDFTKNLIEERAEDDRRRRLQEHRQREALAKRGTDLQDESNDGLGEAASSSEVIPLRR